MQVSVVTRVTIDAKQETVFCYLSQLKYHYLWNPHMRKISPIIELKRGQTYEVETVILGVLIKNINKVAKFNKNKEIEIVNNTGQIRYSVNYRLQTVEGKTQVRCTTVVTAVSNYFAFARPVLRSIAQRELQTDMKALKLAVEHQLT
jgi:hypothetical protein